MSEKLIYVYVKGNNTNVSSDDIVEWLGFLDHIEEIKLQLDVKENDVCYCVRFKHASSAQLAVSNLSGERLKNCLITIKGAFQSLPDGEENISSKLKENNLKTISSKDAHPLPKNDLMPKELKMSDYLLSFIQSAEEDPCLSEGKTVFKALKALQEEWWEIQKEIESKQLDLQKINDAVYEKNSNVSASGCTSSTILATKSPLSLSVTTPHFLLTAISHCVGPIEQYNVVKVEQSFILSFRLMMVEDMDVFFALCSGSPAKDNSSKAQLVRSIDWYRSEDTSWLAAPQNIRVELVENFC